jgi:hypothetical protein
MEQEPGFESVSEPESREIAAILRNIGEERGFDVLTCQEIEAMSFEEAYEVAYSYLTQSGLDAEKVLATLLEQPKE